MCVHVFSHLDVVNWILDHAAWDSWHPPLPEPVGPEPRAPAPPNILREPCEAENLRVCFFPGRYLFFCMKSIWIIWFKKMIHMTWGFQIQSHHSSAVGWDWISWAGWWQLSHLWWAAVHIHGLLLLVAEHHASQRHPKASQGITRQDEAGAFWDHPLSQLGGKHWHGEIIFDIQGSYGFIWVHVLHVLHVLWFKVPSRVAQQNMVGIRCVWKTRSVW